MVGGQFEDLGIVALFLFWVIETPCKCLKSGMNTPSVVLDVMEIRKSDKYHASYEKRECNNAEKLTKPY